MSECRADYDCSLWLYNMKLPKHTAIHSSKLPSFPEMVCKFEHFSSAVTAGLWDISCGIQMENVQNTQGVLLTRTFSFDNELSHLQNNTNFVLKANRNENCNDNWWKIRAQSPVECSVAFKQLVENELMHLYPRPDSQPTSLIRFCSVFGENLTNNINKWNAQVVCAHLPAFVMCLQTEHEHIHAGFNWGGWGDSEN